MRCKTLLASTSLVSALAWLTLAPAQAQNAALTGRVSSAEEAVMEGVLVSAKKDGATITTTVVSNDTGQFSFPADRLHPGRSQDHRRRAQRTRHRRHQARQDQQRRRAALQHRMAAKRAGR